MDLNDLGAVLRAVFHPITPEEKPLIASKSLKEATRRLEQEASLLEQDAHLRCHRVRRIDGTLRRLVEDL